VNNSASATQTTTVGGGPAYNMFNLNASYSLTDNVTVRFGVDNLFNKAPPLTGVQGAGGYNIDAGQLPGGNFNSLYYDDLGRRFSAGVNMKF
jgi:outer membrane receptor protein involved in Fe transport